MIMSAAPPARRTVTETWQACFASGRKNTFFCCLFIFLSFLQPLIFCCCWKTWPIRFLSPSASTFLNPNPRICISSNCYLSFQQHWGNIPICLFIQSTCSRLFCVFLKRWLCFSNCNSPLLLFSNGDCMPTNCFFSLQFDRYRGHHIISYRGHHMIRYRGHHMIRYRGHHNVVQRAPHSSSHSAT